ncbi:MAG TPA: hypothetical protein VFT47_02845 [Vicinamibacterales bacterium]|nr:hypothetical protein [Vicinamibacterales bacterium]
MDTRLPEFDLAPLTRFTPDIIRKDYDQQDAFVLALALVYNDFKTCTWLLHILKHEDDPEAVTPYNGQVSGMRVYALRLYFGILHELLVAIQEAQKAGILSKKEFAFCVEQVGAEGKADWAALVDAATSSTQKDPLRKWLVRVRNSISFHYYNPKDLHAGYRRFFHENPRSPRNEFAFASLGDTLEGSRFYFADAAAVSAYKEVMDSTGGAVPSAEEYSKRVNAALRGIVAKYCESRHILETTVTAATDEQTS